jgi:hypothetical protein
LADTFDITPSLNWGYEAIFRGYDIDKLALDWMGASFEWKFYDRRNGALLATVPIDAIEQISPNAFRVTLPGSFFNFGSYRGYHEIKIGIAPNMPRYTAGSFEIDS